MKALITLSILSLFVSCGKMGGKTGSSTNKNSLGRTIDAISEGSFTAEEKSLGASFCIVLNQKRNSAVSSFGGSFPKKFNFDVVRKECGGTNVESKQSLVYVNNGGNPAYSVAAGTGNAPQVETDMSGVFAVYCANKNSNSRVITTNGQINVYHFYNGSSCGGDNSQICAVHERAGENSLSVSLKRYLVSAGMFLNENIPGQEVYSEEEVVCNGSTQLLRMILRTITN